jgi:hypothetical protein
MLRNPTIAFGFCRKMIKNGRSKGGVGKGGAGRGPELPGMPPGRRGIVVVDLYRSRRRVLATCNNRRQAAVVSISMLEKPRSKA